MSDNFVSLLPAVLQDESNLAIERCAKTAFENELETIVITLFDTVKPEFLPLLAEQFHIKGNEGWNLADTEAEKRNLLKNAFKLHRLKGTKFALIKVLELLNVDGEVLEWFTYDGNPYYFKVVLNLLTKGMNETTTRLLLALVNEYKNERSWLEAVETYIAGICTEKMYTVCIFGEKLTVESKESS